MCEYGYRPIATATSRSVILKGGDCVHGKTNRSGIFLCRDREEHLESAECGQRVSVGWVFTPEQAWAVDACIEKEPTRLSKKTNDRGRDIRLRGRCLIENPAWHF